MKRSVWLQSSLWLAAVFIVVVFTSCTGGGGSGVSSTYVVSGRVVEEGEVGSESSESASGIANVSIVIDGDTTGETVTDDDGYWTFSGVRGSVVAAPVLEGYVFDPAQLDLSSNKPQAAFVAVPAARALSVTYDGNGSTGGQPPEDQRKYIAGGSVQILDNAGSLVKVDHTFNGWNSRADGSGTAYLPGTTFAMPSGDLKLYAQWLPAGTTVFALTMTREGHGAVNPSPGTHSYAKDARVSIRATAAAGWSFSHWEGNVSNSNASSTHVLMDKDHELKAVFTNETESEVFTVTYNGNGSSSGQPPRDNTDYQARDSVRVLQNTGNLAKPDHTFSGWNTRADGGGTTLQPGATFTMPSRDVNLYAQWTAAPAPAPEPEPAPAPAPAPAPVTVSLTMARDGQGTVSPAPGTHTYNQDARVSIKATAAAGWSFSHWVGNASDPKAASTNVLMDKDQKLTAVFIADAEPETFSVTYDGNGSSSGQPPRDTTDYEASDSVRVLHNTGNLVKSGYTFSGWNTRADGTGTTLQPGATFTMPSRSVKLYAKWTAEPAPAPVTVSLTMARDGQGTVSPAPGTHTYNQDARVSIKATAAAGWSFSHWVGNASDSKAASTNVLMDKDQKLTAVFTADTVETASIHGKVVLDGWSVGIIGAVVTDTASGRRTVTDSNGNFSLDGLQSGAQNLHVDGFFNDRQFNVTLAPGQNNSLTLRVPMNQITWAYFDELVQHMSSHEDGTRRWPMGKDLQVYFEVNHVPTGFQSGQVDTSWDAIQQWTSEMGERLSARRVYSSQGADVTVNWVPQGSLPGSAIGRARYSWDQNFNIVKAEITLDVGFSGSLLKALMIHEFAHSLKLGHSPDRGDIMYYTLQNGVVNPSARELEAARLLYSLPTKIRLAPQLQAASLQEMQVEGGAGTHTEYIHLNKE